MPLKKEKWNKNNYKKIRDNIKVRILKIKQMCKILVMDQFLKIKYIKWKSEYKKILEGFNDM